MAQGGEHDSAGDIQRPAAIPAERRHQYGVRRQALHGEGDEHGDGHADAAADKIFQNPSEPVIPPPGKKESQRTGDERRRPVPEAEGQEDKAGTIRKRQSKPAQNALRMGGYRTRGAVAAPRRQGARIADGAFQRIQRGDKDECRQRGSQGDLPGGIPRGEAARRAAAGHAGAHKQRAEQQGVEQEHQQHGVVKVGNVCPVQPAVKIRLRPQDHRHHRREQAVDDEERLHQAAAEQAVQVGAQKFTHITSAPPCGI